MEEKAQVVAHSTKRIRRSSDETNDESLLPSLPQTDNECTSRDIRTQLNNPTFRNKLESQIEDAVGKIEIIDGVIFRWMPECTRKDDTSTVFAGHYYFWADDQGGKFSVGNGGFTFGTTMRAPDAYFHLAENMPPSDQRLLTPTAHPPNLIIETEHEGTCGEAEQKITGFWFPNGVQEAWLLVIPDMDTVLQPAGDAPPVPLPVVQMTQDRPIAPFIAIYLAGNNSPLLGYFPINWHTEFQPPQQNLLFGASPINCDHFMRLLC